MPLERNYLMNLPTKSRSDLLRHPYRQGVLFCAIAAFLTVQTARAQVALDIDDKGNVGIGVQASPDSKLAVKGKLRADDFVGSGSGITGVAQLAKDNTFTGNVYATGFTGSGAGLAGVAQLAKDNTFTGASNTFSGNLSVGTDKAGARLTVAAGSNREIRFRDGAYVPGARVQFATTIYLPPGGIQGLKVGGWITSKATSRTTRAKITEVSRQFVSVEPPGLEVGNGPFFFEGPGPSFEAKNDSGATALLIDGQGQVGIGTDKPWRAKLEVVGALPVLQGSPFAYFANRVNAKQGDPAHTGVANGDVLYLSIWAEHRIMGLEFNAMSDARMKNVIGRSDAARDLATLMRVEVADYTYKDTVTRGDRPQKKVIGQQVEQVFPQAVSKHFDVVPDIYKQAIHKDGWVELATDLKPGERVKLISEKGEEGVHEVLEVAKGRFKTAFMPAGDRVFVYGREVNDFRSIDYDAIAMLNVSATQQIKKELDAKVTALEAENAALRSKLAAQESRLEAIEKMIRTGMIVSSPRPAAAAD
jgi:hypothetical protein